MQNSNDERISMIVKILEIWEAEFQAQKAMKFTDDDGKDIEIAAVDAHKATCILAEYGDGSGIRIPLELPDSYTSKVSIGDTLHIQCRGLQALDRNFRIKNVTRRIPAGSK